MQHHQSPTAMNRLALFFVLTLMFQLYSAIPHAQAEDNGPVNEPKIWTTPDVPIKSESSEPEKKSFFNRYKWWVALGVIVLGGTIAAAGSGGGGDGSDEATGSYEVDWQQ